MRIDRLTRFCNENGLEDFPRSLKRAVQLYVDSCRKIDDSTSLYYVLSPYTSVAGVTKLMDRENNGMCRSIDKSNEIDISGLSPLDLEGLFILSRNGKEIEKDDRLRQNLIVKYENYRHDLAKRIEKQYRECLFKFLKYRGSLLFEEKLLFFRRIIVPKDPYRNYSPSQKNFVIIKSEIVDYFNLGKNSMLERRLDIEKFELDNFIAFKGDNDFNPRRQGRRINPVRFLSDYKKYQDENPEFRKNVNTTHMRYFIDRIVLIEFLFQEFFLGILSARYCPHGMDTSLVNISGSALQKRFKQYKSKCGKKLTINFLGRKRITTKNHFDEFLDDLIEDVGNSKYKS